MYILKQVFKVYFKTKLYNFCKIAFNVYYNEKKKKGNTNIEKYMIYNV